LYAYRFEGYWKDVGTISSLWEANMDLLGKHPAFDIYGTAGHKIYARNQAMPSSYIAKSAEIRESFVAEGCNIEGCITHSIISTGCTVGKGVEITDSVIMPDVTIENGAVIRSAIIAEGCHIKAGARVGDYVEGEERKISVIGKDKTIAEGTVIDAGAIV
jgi:glucose-1-phosphate adenylyltransferase